MAPLKAKTGSRAADTVKNRQHKNIGTSAHGSTVQSAKYKQAVDTPQIPGTVVGKLVAFSLLLLIMPILAYFLSLKLVFAGSTTPSAITAAVTANIVLAGYVFVAWMEDVDDDADALSKRKLE
ncbi:vacuolar ATPase assembly integral membrane protein vma21 [Coemansia sp. RSA 988]|nr:vacuolar ATPase assembly integral membrane protein vma21 [Coemansia sp. RSA 988]